MLRTLVLLLMAAVFGAPGAAAEPAVESPDHANADPFGRKYPPRIYRTARLDTEPPDIDGRLDDKAWQHGEWSADFRQQLPVEGAAPSQATEIKIFYDDRHLYVAVRAYDDPALVHRYPGRRDDFGGYAVDIVGICFDSYNDKRFGFEFDLTAGGGKIDLVLGNGETEWDTTWDAVWDGRVAHDDRGWTAEFRIPFSQLRFGPQDEQVWGLHVWRWIARNHEEDQWQLIPRQNTGRMHQLGELRGVHGLPRRRHLELLPHALGRSAAGPLVPGSGADGSGAVGLDAKLGLSSAFTLDATVNPDFAQVEADPSVVNLTAYETFYEEKRPFFLEGRKIFEFTLDGSDQLFYSRRIGQAPSYTPPLAEGETLRAPASTTILSAVKISGKTAGGMSVGVLQSLTQRETAHVRSQLTSRHPIVEPAASYTVARVRKDWDKGNTSLGGTLTQTHRFDSDASLAGLPSDAITGGFDFSRYLGARRWHIDATGLFSHVRGDSAAIQALQTNPVHYYQRPDARHLGVGTDRTSLTGHGGSLRAGTSDTGRLRVSNQFFWYSPGLEFNDVGFLRQADMFGNRVLAGWAETRPHGIFREYSFQAARDDYWDFGRLHTTGETRLQASTTFSNRWSSSVRFSHTGEVDTRMLRGGPALRNYDYLTAGLKVGSDGARRASIAMDVAHAWSVEDASRATDVATTLRLRVSNRLALSSDIVYGQLLADFQYVGTVDAGDGPRYLLGRIDQDTVAVTFRANLALTPDLTLQYYGSPFISTGRYSAFKRATETLAPEYARRFRLYGLEELSAPLDGATYDVAEREGTRFTFANPDFSFRQFRSNLVLRWEYTPGSSLYVVWSQGRTAEESRWERRFGSNWRDLWRTPADNVLMMKISYWLSL